MFGIHFVSYSSKKADHAQHGSSSELLRDTSFAVRASLCLRDTVPSEFGLNQVRLALTALEAMELA